MSAEAALVIGAVIAIFIMAIGDAYSKKYRDMVLLLCRH